MLYSSVFDEEPEGHLLPCTWLSTRIGEKSEASCVGEGLHGELVTPPTHGEYLGRTIFALMLVEGGLCKKLVVV